MRNELHTVRFTCSGTYLKDGTTTYCACQETLTGTYEEISQQYRKMGWGYVDEFGIRHLCNRTHAESMHES
jgi:hypothetical protein